MPDLVILESETKKHTVQEILGKDFVVLATSGHLCRLKNSGEYNLGVDLKSFSPSFELIQEKKRVIRHLKKAVEDNKPNFIYIATDCDREGEGIGSESEEILGMDKDRYKRLLIYEITPIAIREALSNPTSINKSLVEAQLSRQVLDKMIGFCISPILFRKIKALSAGRVQSVVLKMIVEREEEIKKYEEKEKQYFLSGILEGKEVKVRRTNERGETLLFASKIQALEGLTETLELKFISCKEEMVTIFPGSPLTTSGLLTEAVRSGLSIGQTTKIAQKLYEGVKLKGSRYPSGLITYPRTDSKRINDIFTGSCYNFIKEKWGKDYCNFRPLWKEKKLKHSQEAHEAIRPTYLKNDPELIKESLSPEEYRVYKLIYETTLASLMAPAKVKKLQWLFSTRAEVGEQSFFSAEEKINVVPGFLSLAPGRLYHRFRIKEKSELLSVNSVLVKKLEAEEYEAERPHHYNEGSLVKELEKLGIGRPSTYNSFVPILLKRGYVILSNRSLLPTRLGIKVNEWLRENFSTIINQQYTATLEAELDQISKGENNYLSFIKGFWEEFSPRIKLLEK